MVDCPAALWLFEDGAWVSLVLCPDGLFALCDEDPEGFEVEFSSCRCCGVAGLEFDVVGADCANADVVIATAAPVANNKRLFI